ncbi:hypothetical protein [Pseudomonas sp. zfem002]|uniref:hypothetical protein n=1 Tax=Pseudomonas sp. zfem002 TaxID=3078197 RepID=UPI0029297D24|nr:hypothetical protein [Pseudomonas sp. zfem002]MDU9391961.1 hypothetical protein [Pseudomonas sp. zfem002]
MATESTARIAFAAIVSIVGGLFLPMAAFNSLNRAILLWVCICVAIGLILGGVREQKLRTSIASSALTAAIIPLASIGFYWARWLATWLKDPENPDVLLPLFSGMVGPTDSLVLMGLGLIAATAFIASSISIFLASLATDPLTSFFQKMFSFGPEGFNRINQMLIAVVTVIGSIVVLFSALGAA